jgi:hypothetical protein
LIIDNPNVTSVIVFVPVYGGGRTPATVDERRRALRGFGIELFRIAPLIERLQKTDEFAGLAMGLLDATDGKDEAVLYETEAGVAQASAPAPHVLLSRATFPFAGRTWALVASSPMPSPPGSGIVLTAGVLLSVLLAGIVTALNTIIRLRRRIGAALKLGQYTLEEKLGEGGMGVVYRATGCRSSQGGNRSCSCKLHVQRRVVLACVRRVGRDAEDEQQTVRSTCPCIG